MWMATSAWTPISTPALHLLRLDLRMNESFPVPATGSAGLGLDSDRAEAGRGPAWCWSHQRLLER